ncbi:MAG: hypothetical protein JNK15_25805 [Planctomycetes bacterium]|nr:hypothetical protein [Planctomycetota bacterium]
MAFAEHAALVVVLAGTGLAQLLGQNDPTYPARKTDPNWINQPAKIAEARNGGSIAADLQEFFDEYDNLRHFGPVRYRNPQAVGAWLLEQGAPARVVRLLRAAHAEWIAIVKGCEFAPGDMVTNYDFHFDPAPPAAPLGGSEVGMI